MPSSARKKKENKFGTRGTYKTYETHWHGRRVARNRALPVCGPERKPSLRGCPLPEAGRGQGIQATAAGRTRWVDLESQWRGACSLSPTERLERGNHLPFRRRKGRSHP